MTRAQAAERARRARSAARRERIRFTTCFTGIYTAQQIAQELGVSPRTIERYRAFLRETGK